MSKEPVQAQCLVTVKLHCRMPAGDQDVLAPPGDVSLLKAALPHNSIVFAREYEHYSHLDFTWGMNAHKDVYKDVLHMLANFTAAAQHTA